MPSECIHHNTVRPCKLTFSCWLQGGTSTHGCGTNKWLFSCCVSDKEQHSLRAPPASSASNVVYVTGGGSSSVGNSFGSTAMAGILRRPHYGLAKEKVLRQRAKLKHPKQSQPSSKNVLRRRTDDGSGESDVSVFLKSSPPTKAEFQQFFVYSATLTAECPKPIATQSRNA